MNIMKTLTALAAVAALAGCATSPDQIQASYVSPVAYQSHSCSQLNAEASRINSRVSQLTGQQQQAASSDAAMTAVALVLFFPAAFFLKGDKGNAAELGRMKGESEAIRSAAIQKGCGA